MEKYTIDAEIRLEKRKGPMRTLRSKEVIPAVLYGKTITSQLIKLPLKDFVKFVHRGNVFNTPINLNVKNNDTVESYTVLVKEVQKDPVYDVPLHVDFYSVAVDQKITMPISILSEGKSEEVEKDSILQQQTNEILAEGLIENLPPSITVDVSSMKIGDKIAVKDLKLPENIKIIENKEKILFHMVAAKKVYIT